MTVKMETTSDINVEIAPLLVMSIGYELSPGYETQRKLSCVLVYKYIFNRRYTRVYLCSYFS